MLPKVLLAAITLVGPTHIVGAEVPQEIQATLPKDIRVKPGFQVELVYSVPLEEQGSWVSMAVDGQGRLICSAQRGGLFRLTLNEPPAFPRVEKLAVDIGQAQGLLCAYDSLYVTVCGDAAQGSGFYRVWDSDDDDQFDTVELLKKFELQTSSAEFSSLKLRVQELMIRGGHGPHGVTLGPDGALYIICGNHTRLPEGLSPDSPFRNWAEDLLLPRVPDAQGIATGILAPGGWVLRTDRDGSEWQIFCGGIRNAYDLAFNKHGELFTFDSDMEFDVGTPWYRPCRISHLVSGGEYGWRYGSGKWPDHYPDSVGSVADLGLASPTGIVSGGTTSFPSAYRDALLVGDWAYGRILAVHLSPQGSSYVGRFETLLEGKPLAVTDMVAHPDGSLYFVIGGRSTQSGVYRVRYVGDDPQLESDGNSVAKVQEEAAQENRRLRRELEAYHGRKDSTAIAGAWPHLNSSDRSIRFAARLAIESQSAEDWVPRFASEVNPGACIEAALALARDQQLSDRERKLLLRKLEELPLTSLSDEQLLASIRVFGLALIRHGGTTQETASFAQQLASLLPSLSPRVNQEACRLLISLESELVVPLALDLMKGGKTQEEQFFYAFSLRNMRSGWTIEDRKAYFGWLRHAYTNYSGGASFRGFVQQTLRDAGQTLTDEEKDVLGPIVRGQERVAGFVEEESPRQFVKNWQLDDLIPLLPQLDSGRSFTRGEQVYAVAQCERCHRFKGKGESTGPDLTSVGNRFSSRYILEAILQPSRVIPDEYRTWNILTKDGNILSGRVVPHDEEHILVGVNPYSENLHQLAKSSIESQQPSSVSQMPDGLVSILTKEEVLDLLAYLRSAGNENDAAFQTPPP